MSTDIHGGIEFRHPRAGTDCYDGEPWVKAMDLWPLYDEQDYAAFGQLFGVRNSAGFRPLATGRGLPDDLSSGLASSLREEDGSAMDDATWVTWSELAGLSPTAAPAHFVGRLTWTSDTWPPSFGQWLVPAQWPADVRDVTGPPPPGLDEVHRTTEWAVPTGTCRYEPLTAAAVLGEESHWPHVFAVMRAMAGRFGDDGVRLVVGFL
ncbi:hypothetical protein [Streptomyces sp. MI02-7b]|uniref:hypothetical protein n=1 Tax=Streptomyces sp. MI02-7b TaxID=462941 RepID=UPI0029A26061|nr:hypothetical protein [Streptomyces sp. MI02-7b]MDX3073845.1 hypothetical protein [Streptomyces sp. MI02-7b]